MVAEQLRIIDVSATDIILEPFGRNTASAIALGALTQPDSLLLVLSADHVIKDLQAFEQSIIAAEKQAKDDKLIAFGIVRTSPETGYGYIKSGKSLDDNACVIDQFIEKPDLATAEAYLASGDYLWNSGMFLFKASRYIEKLKKFNPDILVACQKALANSKNDLNFTRIDAEVFEPCPDDSIDYAVMEKTQDAVVVTLDANWSDVGSWSTLWEISPQDENGNVLKKGQGNIMTLDSKDCFIQSDKKLIATIGIENTVVIKTDDALMVAHKDRVQDVKTIVNRLKKEKRTEASLHRKVYRPWRVLRFY